MPPEPRWLSAIEDRSWRAFMKAQPKLVERLARHLLEDSGLTGSDYELLVVLSGASTESLSAQEICTQLTWEKSRLSHQARRMEEQGLIAREQNPADARSVVIRLLPAGRRAIRDAAPKHVDDVRRHFIALFSAAELETLATLNERVLRHLAEDPFPEHSPPDETARRRSR